MKPLGRPADFPPGCELWSRKGVDLRNALEVNPPSPWLGEGERKRAEAESKVVGRRG